MINIFTDASCIIYAGVAGWAALIRYPSANEFVNKLAKALRGVK